jgi:hypothetical protein
VSKKIRVVEDGKEKLVSADFLLSRELRKRETFLVNLALRQNPVIELEEFPVLMSERIYINGMYLTEGIDFDYVIDQRTITFNDLVVPIRGHITVNYKYLNLGV